MRHSLPRPLTCLAPEAISGPCGPPLLAAHPPPLTSSLFVPATALLTLHLPDRPCAQVFLPPELFFTQVVPDSGLHTTQVFAETALSPQGMSASSRGSLSPREHVTTSNTQLTDPRYLSLKTQAPVEQRSPWRFGREIPSAGVGGGLERVPCAQSRSCPPRFPALAHPSAHEVGVFHLRLADSPGTWDERPRAVDFVVEATFKVTVVVTFHAPTIVWGALVTPISHLSPLCSAAPTCSLDAAVPRSPTKP